MRTIFAVVLLSGLSWSAFAGGTAVIRSGGSTDNQVSIDFLGDKARFDMQGQADSYVVIRDSKAYAVTPGLVMDLSNMMQMFGQQAASSNPGEMGSDVARFIGLSDTGRNETVAGISGDVHILKYVDNDGQEHADEVVLSSNGAVRELTAAMQSIGTSFAVAAGNGQTQGAKDLWSSLSGKKVGVLRYTDQMQVVSISGSSPAASRFELPSEPQQLPNFGALGANANASGGGSVDLGAILGQKADRQQDRVENRTDQEVDEATDKAVDKALDKAFKKLFGG